MAELKPCRWCCDGKGKPIKKHKLEWSVIDDDFGQFVPYGLVRFCPMCGRRLNDASNT